MDGPTSDSTGAWPCPYLGPRLEPWDHNELWELRQGPVEADKLETLAAYASRAHAALELTIGDGLAAMRVGDRLVSLGYSCLGDYAREVLGIRERTAQKMARRSRELRELPLLRAAALAGEVRLRAAETVLPVAKGELEFVWVRIAKGLTVRAIEDLVRRVRRNSEGEEEWTRFMVGLEPEERAVVDEALELAGRVLGPASSLGQRLEALAQEYLGGHPVEMEEPKPEEPRRKPITMEDITRDHQAQMEKETERWSHLVPTIAVTAPEAPFDETASAEEIDAELRRLVSMRASWDDALGNAALAVKESRIAGILGFASFSYYASERLGLAPRTVEQRMAVEERLWQVPALHEALQGRKLSYERVRMLSRLPDREIEAWIPRAAEMTCIELRRALQARHETQMRAARRLKTRVPASVAILLKDAFRAVREADGRDLSDGKCLLAIARHFTEVWKPLVPKAKTRSQKVRERDLGRCQVPGCSRMATHAHHIKPKAQGGTDDPWNLVGLCTVHHLRGIHGGYLRVSGTAPGGLVWKLGDQVWKGPRQCESWLV